MDHVPTRAQGSSGGEEARYEDVFHSDLKVKPMHAYRAPLRGCTWGWVLWEMQMWKAFLSGETDKHCQNCKSSEISFIKSAGILWQ